MVRISMNNNKTGIGKQMLVLLWFSGGKNAEFAMLDVSI